MDEDIERQVREIDRAYFLNIGAHRVINESWNEGHTIPLSWQDMTQHIEEDSILKQIKQLSENKTNRRRKRRSGRKI